MTGSGGSNARPRHGGGRLHPALLLGFGALLGLAGCVDLEIAASTVFPPSVPGLDPSQPWTRLPVSAWVNEGDVKAVAIAGCFAPSCAPQAAVGVFEAAGPEADRLSRLAGDPQALVRGLMARRTATRGKRSALPRTVVSAIPFAVEGWKGFRLRLSRQDGSRPAAAAVLTRPDSGRLRVILVLAPAEEAASHLAAGVATARD